MTTLKTLFQNKKGRIRWSDPLTLIVIGLILYNFFDPFKELVDGVIKPQRSAQLEIVSEIDTATITYQEVQTHEGTSYVGTTSYEGTISIIIIIDSDEIRFLDYYDKELNKRTLVQPKKGEMFEDYFAVGGPIDIYVEADNGAVYITEMIPAEYYNQTFYLDLNSNPMLYRKSLPILSFQKPTISTVFIGDTDSTNGLTTPSI